MRPIDADAAKKDFGAHFGDVQDAVCAQQIIDRQPTIDPKDLRPQGRWNEIPNAYVSVASTDGSYHGRATSCSACGEVNPNAYKTNYCPNCGAKMIEEVPNE